tara:strand:+ start:1516 stop:1851 length:336 start_codon:yes stop_codon:yes gene_type:complete
MINKNPPGYSDQDWTTVVLTKSPTIKGAESNKTPTKDENEIVKPKKIDHNLKKSIQQARLNKNISQKELANMMNVPIQTIVNYENGKAIPNNLFISKIEKKLNVKLPRIKK